MAEEFAEMLSGDAFTGEIQDALAICGDAELRRVQISRLQERIGIEFTYGELATTLLNPAQQSRDRVESPACRLAGVRVKDRKSRAINILNAVANGILLRGRLKNDAQGLVVTDDVLKRLQHAE